MPNAKERKKKSGQNKSKKMQAMRESVTGRSASRRARGREGVNDRKARAKPKRRSTDQPEVQKHKPGAADDRTTHARRDAR